MLRAAADQLQRAQFDKRPIRAGRDPGISPQCRYKTDAAATMPANRARHRDDSKRDWFAFPIPILWGKHFIGLLLVSASTEGTADAKDLALIFSGWIVTWHEPFRYCPGAPHCSSASRRQRDSLRPPSMVGSGRRSHDAGLPVSWMPKTSCAGVFHPMGRQPLAALERGVRGTSIRNMVTGSPWAVPAAACRGRSQCRVPEDASHKRLCPVEFKSLSIPSPLVQLHPVSL